MPRNQQYLPEQYYSQQQPMWQYYYPPDQFYQAERPHKRWRLREANRLVRFVAAATLVFCAVEVGEPIGHNVATIMKHPFNSPKQDVKTFFHFQVSDFNPTRVVNDADQVFGAGK